MSRKIDQNDPNGPRVTDDVVYMTADEEDNYHVAQASTKLDENGYLVDNYVSGRYRDETSSYPRTMFQYMDVSPRMVFSVATSLVPFLQNDDANRALMGSNMQRQGVPLITTEAPVVGTGMEEKAARDSGVCVIAKKPGRVDFVDATEIDVTYDDGEKEQLELIKYLRSNQSNCYNQKPIVSTGDHFEEGDILADGASTDHGVLALGKNPLIGFMCWEGYNYEDAVERMFIPRFTSRNISARQETPNSDRKRLPEMFPVSVKTLSRIWTMTALSVSARRSVPAISLSAR